MLNIHIAKVPGTEELVLVLAGSAEPSERERPGNRIAVCTTGTNMYYLCHG